MSFFTNGFATIVNNRRKKAAKNKDNGKSSDKQEEKKDEGRWDMLTDAYGRQYWQHSVTGEWSYVYGGGLVSPVGTVNPSPMVYPGGAVFTPSPVPVFPVTPVKKKEEGKRRENGKGWWEMMYDREGDRYWKHTVSKKITYKDPYY